MKYLFPNNIVQSLVLGSCVSASLVSTGWAHGSDDHKHDKKVTVVAGVTGAGDHKYKADPTWGQMSAGEAMGSTHGGVVLDKEGKVYVSTNGPSSIQVFDASGKHIKKMAPEARGLHHMLIREEKGEEYIYGAQLMSKPHRIVKLNLKGEIVLTIPNEATGEVEGGFKGTTGVAVAADGTIYASMGYGSNLIHAFSPEGKLLQTFGARGKDDGQFVTPHTLSIDSRFAEPRLLVCDRENRRLQHFSLDGKFIGVHATGLNRPCAVSFHGDYVAVAELEARVTILDKAGKVVAHLGANDNKAQWAKFGVKPEDQRVGIFSAPHGLSYDKAGNLYVQDWNVAGRVTKLEKLK